MPKPNIASIMNAWRGGKPRVTTQPVGRAPMPGPVKPKPVGMPGLTSTRNNLRNMRKDTLPKGFK